MRSPRSVVVALLVASVQLVSRQVSAADQATDLSHHQEAAAVDEATRTWWELHQADVSLDLDNAREYAIEIITEAPDSAAAVAAGGWLLSHGDLLTEDETQLRLSGRSPDPQLAFYLSHLTAQQALQAPDGTLTTAELAGPFGVFDTLDINRDTVPPDSQLPPLGTRWRGHGIPFNLLMSSPDGWVGPPESMLSPGVYVSGWTLLCDTDAEGWLVLEAEGHINLELDDTVVAQLRYCSEDSATINWFRLSLAKGAHRLRAQLSSRKRPRVRVTLLDGDGGALRGCSVSQHARGDWADAELTPAVTPAEQELRSRLDANGGTIPELVLATTLARWRGEAKLQRHWLELAQQRQPSNPWVMLELARLYLEQSGGEAQEVSLNRCRDYLRGSSSLPMSMLIERSLALQQNLPEDADRLLDELLDSHGADPRVLVAWAIVASERGWAREAEEAITELAAMLPSSTRVGELRLRVLADLEQWSQRNELLQSLANQPRNAAWMIESLAKSCFKDEALTTVRELQQEYDDPALSIVASSLLVETGSQEEAREEIERAQHRWGMLPALERYNLILASADPDALRRTLRETLQRKPWDIDLRTLGWRLGAEPFFSAFYVDALKLAEEHHPEPGSEIDAVLLLDQAVERVYEDGSSVYYYHGLTKALTPAGARQAAELQHLPDSYLLQLRIIKPDGSEVIPPELYPGAESLVLSDLEEGDLLEEEYIATLEPSGASRRGHLSPYTYRFADAERAFGLSEYVLLVPDGIELLIDGNFTGLERTEWSEQSVNVIRWRAEQVPPMPREPFAPPVEELLPWVSYGFGVTWQDVGDVIRDRILPVLRGSPQLEEWAQRMLEGDIPATAVQRLVTDLCEKVEEGRSSLELETTAGESFSRRRGNRLAIAATALLAAGFDVDLLVTRPHLTARTHLKVPNLDTFIQPVLRCRRGEHELWLDFEEGRRGVDHLAPIFQGSDALVLPLSDLTRPVSYLDRLPEFPNPELEERHQITAEVNQDGDAHVVLEVSLFGPQAERMLDQLKSIPDDRVDQLYQTLAARFFTGAKKVTGSLVRRGDGAVLRFELDLAGACELTNGEMVCRNLVLANHLSSTLATLPERRYDLEIQLPILRHSRLELVFPPGWSEKRTPRRVAARWGRVDEVLEITETSLISEIVLELPAQTISPEEYPSFVRFCHAVDELVSRPPRLSRR